jgi:uncharacterized protein with von Willebrand factor type A (vWA) domain
MDRSLVELVAVARRAGIAISPAEAVDALRALRATGIEDRCKVLAALTATLAKSKEDRTRFARVFASYFEARGATHHDLYQRLAALGFSAQELLALRSLLSSTASTLGGAGALDAVMAGDLSMQHLLDVASSRLGLRRLAEPSRVGFLTMRLLDASGIPRAETALYTLRRSLRDEHGERGEALADALASELARLRASARARVENALTTPRDEDLLHVPFAQLEVSEARAVEREVALLAERLVGRALVRAKHARRSRRVHLARTLRRSQRTGQVPFVPVWRRKRMRRPKLVILCDVSDSVQHAARFMLLFVHAVQRVFDACRSFVFVSDVGEASALFRAHPPQRAIAMAQAGAVVSVVDNSHYARVFATFKERHGQLLDERTTFVIVGDARTNHFDAGEKAFSELSRRAGRTIWLNPEPEAAWSARDSAMTRYLAHVDQAFAVHDLASLRLAARVISAR